MVKFIFLMQLLRPLVRSSSFKKSMSSAGKSIHASTNFLKLIISSINSLTKSEKTPCIDKRADCAEALEDALIKSDIDSACIRSILSFKKALSENSPGLASLAPSSKHLFITISIIILPP